MCCRSGLTSCPRPQQHYLEAMNLMPLCQPTERRAERATGVTPPWHQALNGPTVDQFDVLLYRKAARLAAKVPCESQMLRRVAGLPGSAYLSKLIRET